MTASASRKGQGTYAAYPEDAALQLVDRYHDRLYEARAKADRTRAGQVYTPWPVVEFMTRSTLEQYAERWHDDWSHFTAFDPFCGGGVFPLCMARHLKERIPDWDWPEILQYRVGGADLDLGALLTARAALRTLSPVVEPWLFWSDSLADFPWAVDSAFGAGDLDPVAEFKRIDELNAALADRALAWQRSEFGQDWARHAAESATIRPVGIADLSDLHCPRLLVAPDAAAAMPDSLRDIIEAPLLLPPP